MMTTPAEAGGKMKENEKIHTPEAQYRKEINRAIEECLVFCLLDY